MAGAGNAGPGPDTVQAEGARLMARPKKKPAAKRKAAPRAKPAATLDLDHERRKADEKALLAYYDRINSGDTLKPFEHTHRREIEERLGKDTAEPSTGDTLPSVLAVCEYTNLSKRQVRYAASTKKITQHADGSFDRRSIDIHMARRNGKAVPESAAPAQDAGENCEPLDVQIKKADLAIKTARAEKENLFLEQARGALFSQADVIAAWTERVVAVCAGLEALADRLPPLLVGLSPNDMQPIIKNEIRLLREGFARDGRYTPEN